MSQCPVVFSEADGLGISKFSYQEIGAKLPPTDTGNL